MKNNLKLPTLPLEEWKKSKTTLHLFLQIVGKIKLEMMPRKNHWWNITLRVSSKGLSTGPIPYQNNMGSFSIEFNFLTHTVQINNSTGGVRKFDVIYGLSVSKFYSLMMDQLQQLNIPVKLKKDKPYDLKIDESFKDITKIMHYDPNYVQRYWRILLWVDNCFKEFEGRFYGKTSPIQLYWHQMDLGLSRFSGKKIIDNKIEGISNRDANSHEYISFGFWAGDDKISEPGFYSYIYPVPEGLEKQPLEPSEAKWLDNNGSPMAFLPYHELIKNSDPTGGLLAFMESAYLAGANLAGWDIEELNVPPLKDLLK